MEQFSISESSTLTEPNVVAISVEMCKDLSYKDLQHLLDGTQLLFVELKLDTLIEMDKVLDIAKISKEVGAVTIAVITEPFTSEYELTKELKNTFDSIVGISSETFHSITDNVFTYAVKSISGVVLARGDDDINLDFTDLQTVMSHHGLALMGISECIGGNAAYKAIHNAIKSLKVDGIPLTNAHGIMVHFYMHSEFPFMEISSAMEAVYQSFDYRADIIFGTTTDNELPVDYIRVTIVATGFEKRSLTAVNNVF